MSINFSELRTFVVCGQDMWICGCGVYTQTFINTNKKSNKYNRNQHIGLDIPYFASCTHKKY